MDTYRRLADDHESIRLILTRADLDDVLATWRENKRHDKRLHGIVVKMKGAEPVSEPKQLEEWLEYGVRIVAPAWHPTRYAGSAAPTTAFRCLATNCSRSWPGSMSCSMSRRCQSRQRRRPWNDTKAPSSPATATRATFAKVGAACPDALIRRLAERDGVMGIMVYNRFLRNDWHPADRKRGVSLAHWVDAVDYVCQLTGSVAHVGLGSDIDGGYPYRALPSEIDTSCDLWLLRRLLLERGFSETETEAILGGNMLRKLKECLPNG